MYMNGKRGPPPLPPMAQKRKTGEERVRQIPPPLPKQYPAQLDEPGFNIKRKEEIQRPPLLRIQDKQLERNLFNLFKFIAQKERTQPPDFQRFAAEISLDRNVIVAGKIVGRIFTDGPHIRIYFDMLGWKGNAEQKLRLFTNSAGFIFSALLNCKFFIVDNRSIRLAYSKTEDGLPVMEVPLSSSIIP